MANYNELFRKIAEARSPEYPPRVPVGESHLSILCVKQLASVKNNLPILEAEFLVTRHQSLVGHVSDPTWIGRRARWTWFVSQSGFSGNYEIARAKEFFTIVLRAVGHEINFPITNTVEAMELLVGVSVIAYVTGGVTTSGKKYYKATWAADRTQPEEVLARAAVACEARALALVDTDPEASAQWMRTFGELLNAPTSGPL